MDDRSTGSQNCDLRCLGFATPPPKGAKWAWGLRHFVKVSCGGGIQGVLGISRAVAQISWARRGM
jgi:hypothetical protein